jgi:hypothetical protein
MYHQPELPLVKPSQRSAAMQVFKDGTLIEDMPTSSFDEAVVLRSRFLSRLQQSPVHHVQWEHGPRPTGWFGVRSIPHVATHVYVAAAVTK